MIYRHLAQALYVGPARLEFSITNIEFETNVVKNKVLGAFLSVKSVGVYAKLNYAFGKDLGILLYYIKPITDACNKSYLLVKPILLIIPSITFDLIEISVKSNVKTPKIDGIGLLTIYAKKLIGEYTHPKTGLMITRLIMNIQILLFVLGTDHKHTIMWQV